MTAWRKASILCKDADMAGRQATSTIKRRRIGSLLRKLREEQDPVVLSKDAATHIGIDATRLGRIERGRYRITPPQISGLLNFYGVTDEDTHNELRNAAQEDPTSHWWYAYRKDIPSSLTDFVALENEATKIMTAASYGVAGLLQAPSYAQEMQDTYSIESAVSNSAKLFSVRMHRQQVINRPHSPAVIEAIVTEASMSVEAKSMKDQIRHLMTLEDQPNVTVRVLTNTAPMGCLPMSTFTLMDFVHPWPTTVHLDSYYGGSLDDDPNTVRDIKEFFSQMEKYALPVEETRDFLENRLRKIEK